MHVLFVLLPLVHILVVVSV